MAKKKSGPKGAEAYSAKAKESGRDTESVMAKVKKKAQKKRTTMVRSPITVRSSARSY